MKMTDLSPSRLIVLAYTGFAFAASGFALMANHIGSIPWALLLFSSMILLGGAVGYLAVSAIGDGVRLERWTKADLETPRRIITGRVFRSVDLIAFIIAVGLLIAGLPTRHNNLSAFCLPVCYFTIWTAGIRRALKEPLPSRRPQSSTPVASLQSQHWGH